MKSTTLFVSLAAMALLFNACKKDQDVQPPKNYVSISDLESNPGDAWGLSYYYYNKTVSNNPNNYITDYTTEAAASPSHSFKVRCDTIKVDSAYCVFYQRIAGDNFPAGAELTLKANVKTIAVQGNGASVYLRGYNQASGQSTFFVGIKPVVGTNNGFLEYSTQLNSFPANTDYLYVYVGLLTKTTGTAYFDDISLTAN